MTGGSIQELHQLFYHRHFQAALVQSGASIIMWLFAILAYAIDIIALHHFIGASLSVLYLIAINFPTLWALKHIRDPRRLTNFSTFINLLEILGYTAVIYFLGGIEATYLTTIYAAMIAYVGTVSTRRRTFMITGICIVAYAVMVLLEGAGLIPWYKVISDFHLTWSHRLMRMFVVVGLLLVIAYITSFAATRLKKARDDLRNKNEELRQQTERLLQAEQGLREAQRDLEKRVAKRTMELDRVNKERIKFEAKLHRAKKMEALGLLAGGVAHDLNNILSGIVTYPEMILMDLPENSLLREPIAMIKKSGDKAAAIVQDLLNLARRSVMTTEIVNLNTVVRDYISSPEYEKLKQYHPHCLLEISCRPDLMNIEGSPTQLGKLIMNLVSNAFEAMPEGGTAVLSTQDCHLDRNIGDIENIPEGEYVMLTLADPGMGISDEDRERIFEPFFTKKVMGRSGTGLGMAVVWGTVKDHGGFIDFQSTLGAGTTFRLYFPASRQVLSKQTTPTPLDALKGQGQSVLVVDDVEDQRMIACGILRKLGYNATAVASGEEAIDYLRNNTVDLMVIDMIMDPGINGLETFQAVRKIRPDQKAIIASGYSETESVKTVLRLGADAYVRKPYSIEQIGRAVKDVLGHSSDRG